MGSDSLKAYARTIVDGPGATIVPPETDGENASGALEAFHELTQGRQRKLSLEGTLGEGGMGIVHLATQVALQRKVAVKRLKDGHTDPAAVLKLLREAWITGALEHPNIVPVYDATLDELEKPQIVLKRIEGTEWAELMHDPEAIEARFGRDPLEWNLEILLQVCNAVRFAHRRGILHRDLKPENVMIGEFGEVYVLDWGIAVSLREEDRGRLLLAREARQMAGTPHYMAPEMLGGDAPSLSERSDIYLLGAVLYEIVVGRPPHEGETPMQIVASIVQRQPKLPTDAPHELQQIVDFATASDPDARFENVEQFRLAVGSFVQHRGSLRLSSQARERTDELEQAIQRYVDPSDRVRIHALFSEARFGYQTALEAWRDNPEAQLGIGKATERIVEFELEHGDPETAQMLATGNELPPSLLRRCEEAVASMHSERKAIEELAERGRNEDQEIGRRTRAFLAASLGLFWVVGPLAYAHFVAGDEPTWSEMIAFPCISLALASALFVWARESMTRTSFNRRVAAVVGVGLAGTIPIHLIQMWSGGDIGMSQVYAMYLVGVLATLSMFIIDWRLFPTALVYFGGAALTGYDSSLRYVALSVSPVILTLNVLLLWRFRRSDVAEARNRFLRGERKAG
ncbi:MAG: protein kinase [Myxococcota bacterium]